MVIAVHNVLYCYRNSDICIDIIGKLVCIANPFKYSLVILFINFYIKNAFGNAVLLHT